MRWLRAALLASILVCIHIIASHAQPYNPPSGGAASVTVGTTTVGGSCNTGYNLYNNGGTLGCQVNGGGSFPQTVSGTTTSGGIPYFSNTTTLTSSALLTQYAIIVGGGAGGSPATLASLGTTTTVLHGAAAGPPTFGAVVLTTDVSGILPAANGGTTATNIQRFTTLASLGSWPLQFAPLTAAPQAALGMGPLSLAARSHLPRTAANSFARPILCSPLTLRRVARLPARPLSAPLAPALSWAGRPMKYGPLAEVSQRARARLLR